MVAATPLFCRWRAGNSCHWRSARYDLLHRQQLERSRARQMRKSVHQEWGARWNQSSRWKSLFADRRTWSVDQREAGGIRRAGCDNQRKANRARRLRATSSRRNSEIVIACGRSSRWTSYGRSRRLGILTRRSLGEGGSTRLQENSRRTQLDEMRSIFAGLGLGSDFWDPQSNSFG